MSQLELSIRHEPEFQRETNTPGGRTVHSHVIFVRDKRGNDTRIYPVIAGSVLPLASKTDGENGFEIKNPPKSRLLDKKMHRELK